MTISWQRKLSLICHKWHLCGKIQEWPIICQKRQLNDKSDCYFQICGIVVNQFHLWCDVGNTSQLWVLSTYLYFPTIFWFHIFYSIFIWLAILSASNTYQNNYFQMISGWVISFQCISNVNFFKMNF